MTKVLIACEESQAITKELRVLGIDAYSNDISDCSGGYPEWHIKGDVMDIINDGWSMMIAHPPCTYLAVSGNRWLYNKDGTKNTDRWNKREKALDFVRALMSAPIPRIAIENPVSCISSEIRKPDQIIQPYMFGEPYVKSTCLWLKNLPKLVPTNIVDKGEFKEWTDKNGKTKRQSQWYYNSLGQAKTQQERSRLRSKTFKGIARAIADQWGKL